MTKIEKTKSIEIQQQQINHEKPPTLWNQFSPTIDKNCRKIVFKAKIKKTSDTKKIALNVINGHLPMNGIAAMIQALQPTLDETSAEIASFLIRGDLIAQVKQHPELYQTGLQIHDLSNLKEVELQVSKFSEKIALSKEIFGIFEFEVLADVFKMPIELYSRDGSVKIIRENYPKPSISLQSFENGFLPIIT